MRPLTSILLGCLLLAAAPAGAPSSSDAAVLSASAVGVAEGIVEFTTDVTISGDPSGALDPETDAFDVAPLRLVTEDAFAVVALVQEAFDPEVGPLELIASSTSARGVRDESLIVNGRDRSGPDAWRLDAGRYRLFVISSSPTTFELAFDGLPADLDITVGPTEQAGLLEVEQATPAPSSRQWTAVRSFDASVTALIHTWQHSGDEVTPVRVTSRCRLSESSNTAATWLPGCPTGLAPLGSEGSDVQLLSAGGGWSTSYFYTDAVFAPTAGLSWSVTQDPGTAPIAAGMTGLWWARTA